MRRFIIEWSIHAIALFLAAELLPGLAFATSPPGYADVFGVALVFTAVHRLVKPLVALVTCLFYVLTLGLFHFVVNAILLLFTSWLTNGWLQVDGFWAAFQAGLLISLVSTLLSVVLLPPDDKPGGPVLTVRRNGRVVERRELGGDVIDGDSL